MAREEIDGYLAALDELKRSTLDKLRESILEVVPDAEQCLSYRMPAFKVDGKTVAGFADLWLMSSVHQAPTAVHGAV